MLVLVRYYEVLEVDVHVSYYMRRRYGYVVRKVSVENQSSSIASE